MSNLKAPFPWFGGKSRVASIVWDRFGAVPNYVEPFAGSLAVLLGRPTEPRIETVNDLDCMICNFWRAVSADSESVARAADWPVNEADLHARHLWLVNEIEFRERMKTDPEYFDAKIAGWWVWGICQWIGSGWCQRPEWSGRVNAGRAARGIHTDIGQTVVDKRPLLSGHGGGIGIHRPSMKLPAIAGRDDRGVHRKRMRLASGGRGVTRQKPELSGDSGAAGRGIHASGKTGFEAWFDELSSRLRRVRVCCGDWKRVTGPAVTTCIGMTGLFLDPPYSVDDRADVYNEESRDVANDALCGYEGEHDMPETWDCVAWKANGGFGNQASVSAGRVNSHRERIWFSPHCLQPNTLFASAPAETAVSA